MNLNELYAVYQANPSTELSGEIYKSILKLATHISHDMIRDEEYGSTDAIIEDISTNIWEEFHIEKKEIKKNFSNWVAKSIRNAILDWIRDSKIKHIDSLDDPTYSLPIHQEISLDKSPEEQTLESERLNLLSPDDRLLVRLNMMGYSLDEIAKKLSCGTSTIDRRMKALQQKYHG